MPLLIGTAPNQVPANGMLGRMAYLDTLTESLRPGAGITLGITLGLGTLCASEFAQTESVEVVRTIIDLTGLKGGGTAGDIIGSDSTSINSARQPAYICRLPSQMTVLGGRMTCLETPAGGNTDIDLFSAVEGTGVQDDAISGLTETQLINAGAQTVGTVTYLAADPTAGAFLYLVSQGTTTNAYTAGRFLIELFGL